MVSDSFSIDELGVIPNPNSDLKEKIQSLTLSMKRLAEFINKET